MYTKTFTDPVRFNAEVLNYVLFKEAGFPVPKRLQVRSEEQTVIYEALHGEPANMRHLPVIVDLLSWTQRALARRVCAPGGSEEILQKYLGDVRRVCSSHGCWRDALAERIRAHFYPTVFRDAKPENWLVSWSGRIFVIDFDYVVPSGPLQDIAQFLTGVWINDPTLEDEAALFTAVGYVCKQEPWATQMRCCACVTEQLFAASSLLSLSKKKDVDLSQVERLQSMLLPYLLGDGCDGRRGCNCVRLRH